MTFEDNPPMSAPMRPITDVVQTANELCMAQRQARARYATKIIPSCVCGRPAFYLGLCRGCAPSAVPAATCGCGKPAYRNGLCTGCSEDEFYSKVRALPAGEQFE